MIPVARLFLLVLAALAVLMLGILAIFDTDDVWLVLATVLSIALIAIVVAVDVWRVISATGDDGDSPGPGKA
jgi:hypothetical protein